MSLVTITFIESDQYFAVLRTPTKVIDVGLTNSEIDSFWPVLKEYNSYTFSLDKDFGSHGIFCLEIGSSNIATSLLEDNLTEISELTLFDFCANFLPIGNEVLAFKKTASKFIITDKDGMLGDVRYFDISKKEKDEKTVKADKDSKVEISYSEEDGIYCISTKAGIAFLTTKS